MSLFRKNSRDQAAGKKHLLLGFMLTFLPTGKVKLFLPGLGKTQIMVRGKRRVAALFHLAVTVVLPSPVTVRHLEGGLQQKNDLGWAALQPHARVFRVPEGVDLVVIPQAWVTASAASLNSGDLKSTNVHGVSGELTLLADFTGRLARVGKWKLQNIIRWLILLADVHVGLQSRHLKSTARVAALQLPPPSLRPFFPQISPFS